MRAFPGNDERMSVLHQDSGGIGKSIPSALEISLGHGFCTPRPSGCKTHGCGKSLKISLDPRDFPWVSGNLGRGGWIFQSLPPFGGARIQSHPTNPYSFSRPIVSNNRYTFLCNYLYSFLHSIYFSSFIIICLNDIKYDSFSV